MKNLTFREGSSLPRPRITDPESRNRILGSRNEFPTFLLLEFVTRNVRNGSAVAENEKDQNPSKCQYVYCICQNNKDIAPLLAK